jgi:hypothetical protein
MRQSVDIGNEEFRRSLAETMLYSRQHEHYDIDSPRRQDFLRKSGELFRRAHQSKWRRFLRREVNETREWKEAMGLMRHAQPTPSGRLQLRSPVLQPNSELSQVSSENEEERKRIVAGVITKRSQQLRKIGNRPSTALTDLCGGRLYWPLENLSCGGAEVRSNGFFDVDNIPPWDIWVHYSEKMLVSWVPLQLITVAQSGIDANPEGCIEWAPPTWNAVPLHD